MWNSSRQNVIEGGNAVCGYEKQVSGVQLVNVADFAGGPQGQAGNVSLQQDGV
jgi:hypothetical protein